MRAKRKRAIRRAHWVTASGLILLLFGGAATDSPGNGYLYAEAIVLVGGAIALIGQRMEEKAERMG